MGWATDRKTRRWWGGLRGLACVALIALIAVACGGNGESSNETVVGGDEVDASPTQEEEPEVTSARVEGTWRHVRTNTKVTNKTGTKHPSLKVGYQAKFIYTVRPVCPTGPCDATVKFEHPESDTKGTFDLVFEDDHYESRTVSKGGTCAGVDPAWKATTVVEWRPIEAEDRDGNWVATAYDGTYKQFQTPLNPKVRDAGCGPATILGKIAGKRSD